MAHNVLGLCEVPPCRMFQISTKACAVFCQTTVISRFFFRVWRNNLI